MHKANTASRRTNGYVQDNIFPSKGFTPSGAGSEPIRTKPMILVDAKGYTIQFNMALRASRPLSLFQRLDIAIMTVSAVATPKSVISLTDEDGFVWPNTTAQETPITAVAAVVSDPRVSVSLIPILSDL